MKTYAENNYEVVRRTPRDAEPYYVLSERWSGTTFGHRYRTDTEARTRLAEIVSAQRADLLKPCRLCGRPAGEHVNYQCP